MVSRPSSVSASTAHARSDEFDTTDQRRGAMKYMLFTYRDPSVQLDPEQRAAVPAAVAGLV